MRLIREEIKEHRLLQPAQIFRYKAFIGEREIGDALVIWYHRYKEVHISFIQVHKSFRHRGRGSKLVQMIIADNPKRYEITAYSGADLKDFWFKNGLTRKGRMKPEGLYEYKKEYH